MRGFDKKYKDFPDFILKITEQIWENKDVESIGDFYTNDIPVRSNRYIIGIKVTN